ncbi:MAG: hypothetical protein R3C18_20335 [Planctomycetaceae bacterium]
MLEDIENLRQRIERQIELFNRAIVTECEVTSWVFDKCMRALLDHPHAKAKVDIALNVVPMTVISSIEAMLASKKTDGTWEWPPIGGIGNFGPSQSRKANATEEVALDTFASCVLDRVRREPIADE